MYKLKMIVLTKSYKDSGYCLAGINSQTGKWVRLVLEEGKGITKNYCNQFNLRDEIEVAIIDAKPTKIQPENLLLYLQEPAKILRQNVLWQEITRLHPFEMRTQIFDRWFGYVYANDYHNPGYSLMLIQAVDVNIVPRDNDSRAVANFKYNGYEYLSYSTTDTDYYGLMAPMHYDSAILVVSIGEAFKPTNSDKNLHYKFVAAIYPENN